MQTLSPEQFKAKYGEAGLASFGVPSNQAQPAQPGYISRVINGVGGDLAQRIDTYAGIDARTDTSSLEKGVQKFGQGAGLAANTLETTIGEQPLFGALGGPTLSKVAEKTVGAGLHWLATSPYSVVKGLGDILGQSKVLQEVTHLYDTDTSFRDTVDAVGNTVRLGGDVDAVVNSANFTANVTRKVINGARDTVNALSESTAIDNTVSNAVGKTKGLVSETLASDKIMNRVARLNPTDENKFVQMSGKTPGQYLTETGNFGTPDKIIANEATKFANSLNEVDTAFEKLPGTYKNGAVEDALQGLLEKARNTSSANVKSPYLSQVEDWISKYKESGLDMTDINKVKRLYEREVKLGHTKLMNPEGVQQATNVDNALREWQVKQASDLGFTNVADLNKQTQISRFIINKLGAKIIGQAGNNSMSLTDWIVLAGGNPNAVASFLTKKFFSSASVQSRIAEFLNRGEIKAPIQAKIDPTIENSLRRAFPQGTKPELPAGGSKTIENRVPIERTPASSMEPQSPKGTKTTINPKTGDAYIRDIKTGKVIKIIPKKK